MTQNIQQFLSKRKNLMGEAYKVLDDIYKRQAAEEVMGTTHYNGRVTCDNCGKINNMWILLGKSIDEELKSRDVQCEKCRCSVRKTNNKQLND